MTTSALPPVVDQATWRTALDDLRTREKAATRELDAIAAQRRRLPMVELPDYTLIGEDGPVRLADVFEGRSQLIVYNHMWFDGAEWQCPGCTGFTSQFTRFDFLDGYDARFVIVTNGPIDEALAYKAKVGNQMQWYSSSQSSFGADVGAAPGERLRGQRVPAGWRHRVPHLAHRRPRHRTAQPHLRADRPAALGPPGGVAGLARGLAAVAHLLEVGRLTRHRQGLRHRLGLQRLEVSPRARARFDVAGVGRLSRGTRRCHRRAPRAHSTRRPPRPRSGTPRGPARCATPTSSAFRRETPER